jgi:hypothetical protein
MLDGQLSIFIMLLQAIELTTVEMTTVKQSKQSELSDMPQVLSKAPAAVDVRCVTLIGLQEGRDSCVGVRSYNILLNVRVNKCK